MHAKDGCLDTLFGEPYKDEAATFNSEAAMLRSMSEKLDLVLNEMPSQIAKQFAKLKQEVDGIRSEQCGAPPTPNGAPLTDGAGLLGGWQRTGGEGSTIV